jgi:hypothetical protein
VRNWCGTRYQRCGQRDVDPANCTVGSNPTLSARTAGGAGFSHVIGSGKAQYWQAFSFRGRTAKSGEGPIFLQIAGFSPNLWTARI